MVFEFIRIYSRFDMVERTWSEVMTTGEPPTPRTFHKSVVHDGHMYILGGFDGYRQNDTYRVSAMFLMLAKEFIISHHLKLLTYFSAVLDPQAGQTV